MFDVLKKTLTTPLFRRKSKTERGEIIAVTGVDSFDRDTLLTSLPDYEGEIKPDIAAKLYLNSPYINAAVNCIADYMSTVPLKVYRRSGVNSPKREINYGYPFRMIEYVNPFQTQTDFIKTVISWLVLTDNAFIAIEPSPDEFENYSAFSLYPMNPRWVRVVPDPDTHVDVYLYEVNGKKIYFPKEMVIHMKGFSPFHSWLGMSNLNSLVADIKVERYAKNMAGKFYQNSATISGILTLDTRPDDDEIRKLKKEFTTQYAGGKNAYRIVVLSEGMTFDVPKNLSLEMNVTPSIETSALAHSMVIGVPLGILTGDAEGEKLIDVEAVFWNKTLIPLGRQIEATLTKFLAWPVSTNVSIEFDYRNVAALRLQALDRARVDVAHMMAGKNTPNEIRAAYNEPEYSDADFDGGEEFGNTPIPVFQLKYAAKPGASGVSPSLSLPGSLGGRDQSSSGEANMADSTARRSLEYESLLNKDLEEELRKFISE